MRTLIKNVWVLTMDSDYREYQKGYLIIKNDVIEVLGDKASLLEDDSAFDEVIDGLGGLLMPGFINTHTHCAMIPFRSLGDDMPDRLNRLLFPLEAYMTPDLIRKSSQYGMAEMLLSGVTSFGDMYYHVDEVAKSCEKMGMRGLIGETIINQKTCDSLTVSEGLLYAENFIKKWQNHALITPMIAPHAPYSNTKESLQESLALSKKYQVPVMMHVAEMVYEMEELRANYHMTPVEWLASLGLFEEPFILVHGIFMNKKDQVILQKHKETVKVAHCIGANTKSAKGVAPIKALTEKGVTIGLGTDGPSSGNTLDVFSQMKLFANFHKTIEKERSLFTANEIVKLATIEGAKVLGLDKLVGSLEVGKKADICLIETDSVNMFPVNDPYAVLVYSANAGNVSHVWVNGQLLVATKRLVGHDLSEIREELAVEMVGFKQKAGEFLGGIE